MIRILVALALTATLAACGADGEPTPPGGDTTGGVEFGVSGRV